METNGREKMKSKKKNKKVPSHDANFAGELALIKDQVHLNMYKNRTIQGCLL